jgi:uncharacterized OB-fold protein
MIEGLDEIQLPDSGARLAPYWDAARSGRLLLPRCRSCRKIHWYPRALCPHCLSDEIDWQQASGRGTIFSFSVMRTKTPYVIAFVTLDEGITIMTNIVDCDIDGIDIGHPVTLLFTTRANTPIPVFKPCQRDG